MRSAQTTLKNRVEYCECSEPLDNYFKCKLTDFGLIWRCILAEKKTCPDLDYFKKHQKERKQ